MLDFNNSQQMGAIRGNAVQAPGAVQNIPSTGNFTCLPSDVGCIPAPNTQSSNPMASLPQPPQGMAMTPGTGSSTLTMPFQQAPRATQPGTALPGSQQMAPGFQQPIPITQLPPETYDMQYLNQFLSTQIGRYVTVEFLIGTNSFLDRSGILLAVGTNYILLQEANTDDILACDFYNIKFVRFYY